MFEFMYRKISVGTFVLHFIQTCMFDTNTYQCKQTNYDELRSRIVLSMRNFRNMFYRCNHQSILT